MRDEMHGTLEEWAAGERTRSVDAAPFLAAVGEARAARRGRRSGVIGVVMTAAIACGLFTAMLRTMEGAGPARPSQVVYLDVGGASIAGVVAVQRLGDAATLDDLDLPGVDLAWANDARLR